MPKEERKPLKFYLLYSREKFANICFRLCVTHLSLRAREKYVVLHALSTREQVLQILLERIGAEENEVEGQWHYLQAEPQTIHLNLIKTNMVVIYFLSFLNFFV